MAKKPHNVAWIGFTSEQAHLLDYIDHLGNNGWARNSQLEAVMTGVLDDCVQSGLSLRRIIEAMRAIGYSPRALHQLERWESKRTTGKFGR